MDCDVERYSRQTAIPDIGPEGQARLARMKVLVAGAGGLGTPCASYLAGMGVGHLCIVDSDVVSLSNLTRQIMYSTADIGNEKATVLASRLHRANPGIHIEPLVTHIDRNNAPNLISGFDVVASCLDNLETRYILNEACVRAGIPMVEAGIMGFTGMVTVIKAGQGPCYNCLFPQDRSIRNSSMMKKATATYPLGVLGSTAGIAGSVQAGEVLKLLLGIGEPLVGRMLLFNHLRADFRLVSMAKSAKCPVCGHIPEHD
ncbi:MAG: HesA/MoeB/ThiF family protein [Bacillota bacterium]|jgi:molybdopterin/thiamine biosynthesis adenylyltransferase